MDKCNLCSESFDLDNLIEIRDSLIKLKSGTAEFSNLIFNVFPTQVSFF